MVVGAQTRYGSEIIYISPDLSPLPLVLLVHLSCHLSHCRSSSQLMTSSTKKGFRSNPVKKQAAAKQALKKSAKRTVKSKSQNAQLLDLLDQKASSTIQEAFKVRQELARSDSKGTHGFFQPSSADIDFSGWQNSTDTQQNLDDLTSIMQKI